MDAKAQAALEDLIPRMKALERRVYDLENRKIAGGAVITERPDLAYTRTEHAYREALELDGDRRKPLRK
jgi:hypothetical protein